MGVSARPAGRSRLIAPDLRGHGRSTGALETKHPHAQFAADLVALLDHDDADRERIDRRRRGPRRDSHRLGFALQLGTVRFLGTFLADPLAVPAEAVAYVAAQLGIADPACLATYPARAMTPYEHTWEIRRSYGYREFAAAEGELRAFLAARAWTAPDGPRALFDRTTDRVGRAPKRPPSGIHRRTASGRASGARVARPRLLRLPAPPRAPPRGRRRSHAGSAGHGHPPGSPPLTRLPARRGALPPRAPRRGPAPAYLATLLRAFGEAVGPGPVASGRALSATVSIAVARGPDRLAEPLSDRERAVLRLRVAGRSGPEGADGLVVAPGTVRTHLTRIDGQLDVHGRDQAIARTRELQLR